MDNVNSPEINIDLNNAELIDTTKQIQTDDIVFCLPNTSFSSSSSCSCSCADSSSTTSCTCVCAGSYSTTSCGCDPTSSVCNCVMRQTITCYAKPKAKEKKLPKKSSKLSTDFILKTAMDVVIPKGVRMVLVEGESNRVIKVILPHYRSKCIPTKIGELSKSIPVTINNLGCGKVIIKAASGQCIYKNKNVCLKEGETVTFQLHNNTWYKI